MNATSRHRRTGTTICRYLCVFLAGLALAADRPPSDHLADYWDGREAFRQRKYREAVVYLDRAIVARPDEGGRVRWTGTHFETYLPQFHMGRALFELDLLDEAAEVWAESLRQGAIRQRANRRELRELERGLAAIDRERRPAQLERLGGQIAGVERTLEQWRERGIGGLAADVPTPGEAEQALTIARERLGDARRHGEAGRLGDARRAVTEARERMLVALERAERRREAERRAAHERLGADAARAMERLAADRDVCSHDALATLREAWLAGALPGDAPDALVALDTGHRACGDPVRARQYARLREHAAPAADSPLPALLAAIEPGWPTYLAARAAAAQRCDPHAAALMEAHAAAAQRADPTVDLALDLAGAARRCGDAERAAAHLTQARRAPGGAAAEELDRLRRWLRQRPDGGQYAESHALVIGVSRYADSRWDALPETDDDARRVAALLERHGFRVTRVQDPTSERLSGELERFYTRKRPSRTRLVFYYGGHGHTEVNRFLRLGYIVPADTPFPEGDRAGAYLRRLISMDRFERLATATGAEHAMFLFDSCFSGTIFDAIGARVRDTSPDGSSADERLARPVRLFVTAGDESQAVPADSRFRAAVVRALEGFADDDDDGLVLGAELGRFVGRHGRTPRNTPQWGVLDVPGFDGGELAFEVPEARVVDDAARRELLEELALWIEGGAARYLARYPDGHLAAAAAAIAPRG